MARPESAAGTVPVERAELVTQDMEMIAELISQLYVEHQARFSCADPSRVEGSVRSAAAGGLTSRECITSGSPWCRSRGRPRAGWPKRLPAYLPQTYGSTR